VAAASSFQARFSAIPLSRPARSLPRGRVGGEDPYNLKLVVARDELCREVANNELTVVLLQLLNQEEDWNAQSHRLSALCHDHRGAVDRPLRRLRPADPGVARCGSG